MNAFFKLSAMKDAQIQTPTCFPCFRKCPPHRNATETQETVEFIILLYSKDCTQWPSTQVPLLFIEKLDDFFFHFSLADYGF